MTDTVTTLERLLTIDATPTDHDLIRACLAKVRGHHYPTLPAMYKHFRDLADAEGYTDGLSSGPSSISCVTQYYQPRDRKGQVVLRFNPELSEEDNILIWANCDGYFVTYASR
jgi:hypothetical protein